MDTSRIERALREGPPDEPVYVPGTFRRGRTGSAWTAFVTVAVSLALVAGVAVGLGLAGLGQRSGSPPEPTPVVMADLLGTWRTDVITRTQWIEGATAAGFDSSAISNFLEHEPIQDQVRYTAEFFTSETTGDRVSISGEYDGGPPAPLSAGAISLDSHGVMHYTEIVPGTAGPRVSVTAQVTINGGQLRFQILGLENASPDDQIANTAFFEMAPFRKAGS